MTVMPHTIRVRIMNREFSLLVKRQDEGLTRDLAAYLDAKIREFRRAHPEQPELTAAIIAALAITEELFTLRDDYDRFRHLLDDEIGAVTETLTEALNVNGKEE